MMTKDRGYGEKVGKAGETWRRYLHHVFMVRPHAFYIAEDIPAVIECLYPVYM